MHDDKTQCLLCDAPITVFDLHLTAYTLAMPAPGDLVASPPRLLEQEWEGRLVLPPAFECLADGTGARDERDEVDLMLETHAQCAATIGLTIRDDPTHSLQAQGQTFFNRHGSFHTIAAVAITHTEAQGYAAIPAHAQTEEHLFEVGTTVFAMPVDRPRSPRRLRFVLRGPIERNRGGVLMQPGRRDSIDL